MIARPHPPWLSVVGIGEDGLDGLAPTARAALAQAEILVGGHRHLALIPDDGRERRAWPSPWDPALRQVTELRGQPVCVLASGDPMWHGVGAGLAAVVPAAEMRVYPAPSAVSLAASRLGWPLDQVDTLSLHGRDPSHLLPYLYPGARLLVLTADGGTAGIVAALLTERGFGPSQVTVLEHLGGPHERIWADTAAALAAATPPVATAGLTTLAIACTASDTAMAATRAAGLPDSAFAQDGQITKPEVRATSLAALAPYPGALLWDVGAGCGAVAIEWLRSDRRCRAVAIERRADRIALIRQNAVALGTPGLEVVAGAAPAALAGLPTPDAIFIGGGLHDRALWEACWAALRPGGRLVANAVTLDTERVLFDLHGTHGGTLTRLAITRAEPIGPYWGWRPLMPVTQWAVTRPRPSPGLELSR